MLLLGCSKHSASQHNTKEPRIATSKSGWWHTGPARSRRFSGPGGDDSCGPPRRARRFIRMRGAQSHIGKGVRLAKAEEEPTKAEEEPTTRSFLLSQPYFELPGRRPNLGTTSSEYDRSGAVLRTPPNEPRASPPPAATATTTVRVERWV